MSMSTHIVGIKPPDEKWQQMKSVWDACEVAKINVPDEVWDFFGGDEPDPNGVVVKLTLENGITEINTDSNEGYLVDITKLPADVKWIRFENSW